MYNIIVAHTVNGGIGKNGKLPWPRIRSDMKHFQDTTSGHRVIMGRKTWESIVQQLGSQLPNRENIVLTSNPQLYNNNNNMESVLFTDKGLRHAIEDGWSAKKKTFVIGGAEIYEQCFQDPYLYKNLQTIYRTVIMDYYVCDRFIEYPNLKQDFEQTESKYEHSFEGKCQILFEVYTRINKEEQAYLSLLYKVLNHGICGPSRTNIETISTFGEMLKFDVSDETIPILTTKHVPFRLSLEEMLFFVSGSTDVQKLRDKKVHIWDGNTTREYLDKRGLTYYEEFDMGPTYSFLFRHAGAEGNYLGKNVDYTGQGIDQLQSVVDALKTDEPNRRIMINLWSAAHLNKMSLPPCLFNYIFKKDVVRKEDVQTPGVFTTEKHVSLMVTMRSADLFLGVPFNLTGATVLLRMVCHLSGCLPKELCVIMADAHIYANHIDQVKLQLDRHPFPFPKLRIHRTPDQIKSIDDFKTDDFELFGYKCHPIISAPMAI